MSYTYSQKKRGGAAARKDGRASPPALDALRSGAAQPTNEQLGHRVDLPEAMREKMENAFGSDLSAVKLYESEAVADAGANAVAQGSRIAFAPGMLDFTSYGGQALLGHEISHVVSQSRGEVTGGGFLNDRALEARADREGAMAAAGRQVAMPAAAMSSATAESAAGPMQAKKKPEAPRKLKTPTKESIEAGQYKEGDNHSTAVTSLPGSMGKTGVLKMGADIGHEQTMSTYYNLASKHFDKKHKGKWSFDAPGVRGLTDKEKRSFAPLVGAEKGKLHSSTTDQAIPEDKELDHAAVFGAAEGKSLKFLEQGGDPETYKHEDQEDYERMMGYISILDAVTGNRDRIYGAANPGNWIEQTDKKRAHLIDNDFTAQGTLNFGVTKHEGRDAWLTRLMTIAGKGAEEKDPNRSNGPDAASTFVQNSKDYNMNSQTASAVLGSGEHAAKGVREALSDLPALQEQMKKQFESQPGGADDYQKELIERMQITHEFMTDRDMAPLYRQLAAMGFESKGPDDSDNATREDLKRQIAALRARKRTAGGA